MCRFLVLYGVSAVLETGGAVIQLLITLSERHNSQRRNPLRSSEGYQEQIAILALSMATTLVSFSLTMVGAGSVLRPEGCRCHSEWSYQSN